VPCILVVEGGLVFDPGIAGDLEQIRFPPGDFRSVDVRVAWQVDALMNLAVDIPSEVPACPPDVRVRLLNLEGREYGRLGRWADVKRVSDEALRLDPKATSAAINKGVALVHLGYFADAEGLFMQIPAEFNNADDSQLSKVHQNLAWVKRVRDAGSLEPESLREQVMHLKESLTLDPRNVYARAYLLLCRVALGELEEARALLMESLNDWDRFLKALDKVVEAWGGAGHRLLGRLPDALYSLLFPARKDDDDDDDGCGPLAA
jgi:tetratricopeptide (TPR) repeat protein